MLTDGRTDGRTENWTPISHPATSRCDKKDLFNDDYAIFSDFLYKGICCGYSFELHRLVPTTYAFVKK